MRFFIYSRKSVYTGKGESIENQIEMCRQYINAKFPDTAHKDIVVYEDEGFSAKNTDRPQFKQMLIDKDTKKPDYIVCYRLDRISRNVSDFSSLIEDLNRRSISFVCIKEEFDTSKPMGKAMMYIASVFAQLERETIAERVRDNMLMLARTGRWLGGTTPTGYTSEKIQEIIIDGRVKTACKLRENPDELCAVDLIFDKFLELRSISGVSKFLIRQGVTSRKGTYYSLPGIKDILQNPVYCTADKEAFDYFRQKNAEVCFGEADCSGRYGLLSYNKRDYKKKQAPRQPIEKWIIAIGRHKGRITGKNWAAVQNIIEENIPTGKKPAKTHNEYALLSGRIYCQKCGGRMFAKPRSGTAAFDYICGGKLRAGASLCDCQNLNGRQTDAVVQYHLMPYAEDNADIYRLLEKLKKEISAQGKETPLSLTEAGIKKCGDEIDNLVAAASKENLSDSFLRRMNARVVELEKEMALLSAQKAQLMEDRGLDTEARLDGLAASLGSLKDNFKSLSVQDKRALIDLLTEKIVWDGSDIHIFLRGWQEDGGAE